MSTYPTDNRSDFVQWCQAHDTVFIDNAPDIGLTAPQAEAFEILTVKAADAIRVQREAAQAAMAATQTAKAAVRALRIGAGDVVRTVRAYAENAKNPLNIYNKAQIAPPADRMPTPAPERPRSLSATLDATRGALTIRWKARNSAGTSGTNYLIRRKLPGEDQFAFVGVSGAKLFDDATIPEGVTQVEYTVQAVRGKRAGAVSAILTVRMGSKRQNANTSKSQMNPFERATAAKVPVLIGR
ncbi:MAG: fibronectin type III domain-containing protein [Planctomycetes bacterium]|nr:fibronectin type III domain-containing protein [Planctomycetota bacterium]